MLIKSECASHLRGIFLERFFFDLTFDSLYGTIKGGILDTFSVISTIYIIKHTLYTESRGHEVGELARSRP